MNLREAFMAAGLVRPAPVVTEDTVTQRPVVNLTGQPILMWQNGIWSLGYHKHFFDGMLKEHLRQIQGYKNKQMEEIRIRAGMACGEVVYVNKVAFRYKHKEH